MVYDICPYGIGRRGQVTDQCGGDGYLPGESPDEMTRFFVILTLCCGSGNRHSHPKGNFAAFVLGFLEALVHTVWNEEVATQGAMRTFLVRVICSLKQGIALSLAVLAARG
jgi:hypothetical protein